MNPSAPENLAIQLEDLSAIISWESPANLGNPEVSYYSLVIHDDQGFTHTNETLPASGVTEFTASGLLPLTNYTVELTAISQLLPLAVTSHTLTLNFLTSTSGSAEAHK